jgi:hypothetical protein
VLIYYGSGAIRVPGATIEGIENSLNINYPVVSRPNRPGLKNDIPPQSDVVPRPGRPGLKNDQPTPTDDPFKIGFPPPGMLVKFPW